MSRMLRSFCSTTTMSENFSRWAKLISISSPFVKISFHDREIFADFHGFSRHLTKVSRKIKFKRSSTILSDAKAPDWPSARRSNSSWCVRLPKYNSKILFCWLILNTARDRAAVTIKVSDDGVLVSVKAFLWIWLSNIYITSEVINSRFNREVHCFIAKQRVASIEQLYWLDLNNLEISKSQNISSECECEGEK